MWLRQPAHAVFTITVAPQMQYVIIYLRKVHLELLLTSGAGHILLIRSSNLTAVFLTFLCQGMKIRNTDPK